MLKSPLNRLRMGGFQTSAENEKKFKIFFNDYPKRKKAGKYQPIQ